jgi:hypothetical protein
MEISDAFMLKDFDEIASLTSFLRSRCSTYRRYRREDVPSLGRHRYPEGIDGLAVRVQGRVLHLCLPSRLPAQEKA